MDQDDEQRQAALEEKGASCGGLSQLGDCCALLSLTDGLLPCSFACQQRASGSS